jgi:hypothetical protein
MIDKWLKAGVLEQGQISFPGVGTPQGGVISPVLSSVFLHYVLDDWFAEQVQPRLCSASALVRYCDDFVSRGSGAGPHLCRCSKIANWLKNVPKSCTELHY